MKNLTIDIQNKLTSSKGVQSKELFKDIVNLALEGYLWLNQPASNNFNMIEHNQKNSTDLPAVEKILDGLDDYDASDKFIRMVLTFYANGNSKTSIANYITEVLGIKMTYKDIDRITQIVLEQMNLWHNKPLEENYLGLQISKGMVTAITIDGKIIALGYHPNEVPKAIAKNLLRRGFKSSIFITVDDEMFIEPFMDAFPKTAIGLDYTIVLQKYLIEPLEGIYMKQIVSRYGKLRSMIFGTVYESIEDELLKTYGNLEPELFLDYQAIKNSLIPSLGMYKYPIADTLKNLSYSITFGNEILNMAKRYPKKEAQSVYMGILNFKQTEKIAIDYDYDIEQLQKFYHEVFCKEGLKNLPYRLNLSMVAPTIPIAV